MSDYATVCGVCGASVSQEAAPEITEYPPKTIQPQEYEYNAQPIDNTFTYDIPAPKKSKKGLLWGLIGGGVGLIVLVFVLCFVFCGGSVEFGAPVNDAHDAMLSNGFAFGLSHHSMYVDEQSAALFYKGEVDGLDNCPVTLYFNLHHADTLYKCKIDTKVSLEKAKEFVSEHVGASCNTYNNPYANDETDEYIYICENGSLTAIITPYLNNEYPDLSYTEIRICDTKYMASDERDVLTSEVKNIKDE